MPRLQFSLKSLLWLMVCVACFFAGARSNDHRWRRERIRFQEDVESLTVSSQSANYRYQRLMQHLADQQREKEQAYLDTERFRHGDQ